MEFDLTAIGRKGFEIFGTAPPTQQEVQKAKTILAAAPTSDPIAVARYFEGLSETNVDGEGYNAEWKVRSNPLIVSFFLEATNYGAGATDIPARHILSGYEAAHFYSLQIVGGEDGRSKKPSVFPAICRVYCASDSHAVLHDFIG